MRLRNIPGAREVIAKSEYVVKALQSMTATTKPEINGSKKAHAEYLATGM